MTRVSRVRSKTQPYWPGTYDYYRNVLPIHHGTNSGDMFRQNMTDSHGRPVVPSPLTSDKWDRSGLPSCNGEFGPVGSTSINWAKCVDYVPGSLQNWNPGHSSFPTRPLASDDMTKLIARTNPSRPDITPPNLIQDLVEIPKQLKDAGRLMNKHVKLVDAKDIANQNLAVQFGWLPLIQDALDVLHLGKHIQNRLDEIHRLKSAGGLKRRIRLGNWGGESVVKNTTFSSVYVLFSGDIYSQSVSERWGTVRWLPLYDDIPIILPDDRKNLLRAFSVASGLTPEGMTTGLWDLMPWSWLVDWFGGVGDHLLKYSNTIPAYPSEACVMTRTFTKSKVHLYTNNVYIVGGDGSMTYETLERYVGSGTVHAHWPNISVKRLSVLGSLFIQRFKKH